MQAISNILAQYADWGLLYLRIVIGIIFIVHARPKLKNPGAMAQGLGWPVWSVSLFGTAEILGGLSVLLGFLAQLGAAGLSIVMLGAIYHKVHKWKTPFMAHDKTGWEFDLLLLASNVLILLIGAGSYKIW